MAAEVSAVLLNTNASASMLMNFPKMAVNPQMKTMKWVELILR